MSVAKTKLRVVLVFAIVPLMVGCARTESADNLYYPTSVFGSTLPPLPAYGDTDPYHYRCTGQCLRSF